MSFDKFNTSKFLKERVFVGVEDKTFSKEESQFINDILKKSVFAETLDIDEAMETLSIIDNNYECDSYSFKNSGKMFVLKINEDDPDEILKREFEALKTLEEKPIAPSPILYDSVEYAGSQVFLMVCSLETSDSFADLEQGKLISYLEVLANNFSYIHETTQDQKENEIDLFLKSIFDQSDFNEIIPKEALENILKQIPDLDDYIKFLSDLKISISSDCDQLKQNNISLCHTALSKSRILLRDFFIKFINFQDSFYLDPFFDITLLIFYTGINKNQKLEKQFLNHYIKFHQKIDMESELAYSKLTQYKKVCYKLLLIRLSSLMIIEIAIHKNNRPHRMFKFIKLYENIRPYIKNDYPEFVMKSDAVFYLIRD